MRDLEQTRKEIEDIDKQMAELFNRRMACSAEVAEYKKLNGLPILDKDREKALLERNEEYIGNVDLKPYYRQFLQSVLDISKQYQHMLSEN